MSRHWPPLARGRNAKARIEISCQRITVRYAGFMNVNDVDKRGSGLSLNLELTLSRFAGLLREHSRERQWLFDQQIHVHKVNVAASMARGSTVAKPGRVKQAFSVMHNFAAPLETKPLSRTSSLFFAISRGCRL